MLTLRMILRSGERDLTRAMACATDPLVHLYLSADHDLFLLFLLMTRRTKLLNLRGSQKLQLGNNAQNIHCSRMIVTADFCFIITTPEPGEYRHQLEPVSMSSR